MREQNKSGQKNPAQAREEEIVDISPEAVEAVEVDAADEGEPQMQQTLDDVPDYATTSDAIRERIDGLIDELVQDLDSTVDDYGNRTWSPSGISSFGSETMTEIKDHAERIIKELKKGGVLERSMRSVKEVMDDLQEDSSLIDDINSKVKNFVQQTADQVKKNPGAMAGAAAGAGLGAVTGFGLLAPALVGILSGKGMQLVRDRQAAKEREKNSGLPAEVEEMMRTADVRLETATSKLVEIDKEIHKWIADLEDLSVARLQTYQELVLYISAGREMVKRVQENELRLASEAKRRNPGFLNSQNEARIAKYVSALATHVDDLYLSCANFINNANRAQMMIDAHEDGRRKIRLHLTMGVGQQKEAVANIGMTLRLGNMAEAITVMDKFSADANKLAGTAQNMITQMMLESQKQGVHDEERTIENLRSTTDNMLLLTNQKIKAAQNKTPTAERVGEALREMNEAASFVAEAENALALTKATGDNTALDALEDMRPDERKKKSAKPGFNSAVVGSRGIGSAPSAPTTRKPSSAPKPR